MGNLPSQRSAGYKPGLAWFAAIGSLWVFLLVTLGAFTTSIGAGMIFADWPLSNGSVNPTGWLNDVYMFAEHSHRLTGAAMGLITIGLAIWIWRREPRGWLRKLGWSALVVVIVQGLIGGQRVMLDRMLIPGFGMTVGQLLRIPHGMLAQIYICILIAIAVSLSRPWIERSISVPRHIRIAGIVTCALLLVQLAIATVMRHNGAGLAIPYFPWATAEHSWLPESWPFPVAIHFAHRLMAVVLGISLVVFALMIRLDSTLPKMMRALATVLIMLLVIQITLGAEIIWTLRDPEMTTGHVVVGALLLASTFMLTWLAHRNAIEGSAGRAWDVERIRVSPLDLTANPRRELPQDS